MKRFSSLLITLTVLLATGCIPRLTKPALKPEEIPAFAFTNLKRQRSFAFDYRLEIESPVAVKQHATGIYILPDQEEIQGRWIYKDGSELSFYLIGSGDKEYEKTDQGWDIHSRGEETDLLVQVERARALGKFKLVKEKPDYEFEFAPNVPFLDPTFTKKIKGSLVINRNYLPKRIAARDEKGTAAWQVEFKDYNRPGRVNLPLVKQQRVLLASADPKAVLDLLKQRFLTCEVAAKISAAGGTIEVVLAEQASNQLLTDLIAPGVLTVAPVRWLDTPADSGGQTTVYQDRPVAVENAVLANRDVTGARVTFDPLGRPVLEILLNPSAQQKFLAFTKANLKHHYGVLIDGRILTVNYIDKVPASAIISITELPTYKDACMIQAIINSGALPQAVKIIEKGE
jgi:hypothetical protein